MKSPHQKLRGLIIGTSSAVSGAWDRVFSRWLAILELWLYSEYIMGSNG
jgi:hypothetical protein